MARAWKPTAFGLGPLEASTLQALWNRGTTTAVELVELLDRHPNTIRTTLERLHDKGITKRSFKLEKGRPKLRYQPRLSEAEMGKALAGKAVQSLVDSVGSDGLPGFLVEAIAQYDPDLLPQLNILIERSRQKALLRGSR